MHRMGVLLAILVAAVLIAGCAQTTAPAPASGGAAAANVAEAAPPCRDGGRGVNNPDAPIVCVDDSGSVLRVNPDPFLLHERHSRGSGAGAPAVQWFTTSGRGDLRVVFRDERCVRNVVCNDGHCTAVAARLAPGEKERRCKYDVELTGHPTLDPEGVLTGCCISGGG